MSTENDTDLKAPDLLETLKKRADVMGIKYHPSISAEKLKEKINAALADEPKENDVEPEVPAPVVETENQRRKRMIDEARRLIRIRVTCMNPAKKELEGELFTAGNSVVGSYTKYVPFNAEDGWHVPYIIYKVIRDRQCQIFQTTTDSKGNRIRKGKLIKEFAVEVLPQLTKEELHDLAQRQAMAGAID